MSDFSQNQRVAPTKGATTTKELEFVETMSNSAVDQPHVHAKMNPKLFVALLTMSFLWIGSQIPLYLFGSVLPLIYSDLGGVDRYVWFIIGYLIPCAALCPFVGALSDIFGRKMVAIVGQVLLILGPVVTSTANTMNIAIAGQVFSGLGAGLNELIALAGTADLVPVNKRGQYVGAVVLTILPFCASTLYAQLIARDSDWRYVGIFVGAWNFLGLVLCIFSYSDPPRISTEYTRSDVMKNVDYIGGILSTVGVVLFMMGMQWGAEQYEWQSVQVLVPFLLGVVILVAFFVYEFKFAKYPMCPAGIFSKDRRTMICILLITFLSGANFFVMLLFYPTQVFHVWGHEPVSIGLRTLPMGFGIVIGAAISLILIPVTRGRIKHLMIFFTAMMTAGTGAMAAARTDNLPAVLGMVTVASLGVGGVIIPCSIIAQLICPHDLLGTITAITLSIRYVGGAIGYTAYYNVFYDHFTPDATRLVAIGTIVLKGIVNLGSNQENLGLIEELTTLAAKAQFAQLHDVIATDSRVNHKDIAFDLIVDATEEAMALAYRWPYWMSIAFGGICVILAFFVRDIRAVLDEEKEKVPVEEIHHGALR
ncbi:MFS general substrate transporter [Eremomyces bilateralis CBS 781.70]|uniref:MFS general substrate transporter n=1 Tax=Eremomyces bilateralis CBS 781.70 TaxID=1392243 RepID=A0A6G1GED8_9PEZI|nr:MFS general substrate transporter [Eremomyces bilateralis CBS 781.70]KAF1816276.1 MFS general substrate transporter [Eremomyces bilateralis CBS 781.70]